MNFEELLFGIFKRTNIFTLPTNHPLHHFPIISFNKDHAEYAARLEVKLEQMGLKKPKMDTLIAAISIKENCRIYTLNLSHFEDIPDIQILK